MKNLVVFVLILSLTGCATSLRIDKLQNFEPESKIFVLNNSNRFDAQLRVALAKKGFKVMGLASTQQVISKGKENEIARIYNEAEARYGITFYWELIDRCIYNSSRLINGTFEITDLKTNEVLLVIENGGWTGPCADPRGLIFDEVAQTLSDYWKN